MKTALKCSLVLFLAWPLVSYSLGTEWTEDDWQPLTNEPSRNQLQTYYQLGFEIEAVPRDFRFPEDTLVTTGGPKTFGIDISHYNPSDLPFTKFSAKNIRYVFIKATQGTGFKDPKFQHFWNSIGSLPATKKVARGAYHFLSASSDPILQAERHVAYVNLHGGYQAADLSPVVDLEWDKGSVSGPDRWSDYTPSQIISRVLQYLVRVEALTGKIPMVYTSKAWWRERQIPDSEIHKLSRYKLWLADYSIATRNSENPRGPDNVIPELWQFTDRAKITGGPTSGFDGNMFKGTLEEFLNEFTTSTNFLN